MNRIFKNIIGLVTALAVIVGIAPTGVKADDNTDRAWTTYSYAPGAEQLNCTIQLFSGKEEYVWSVTDIKLNGCTYSYVELGCNNGTISMKNGISNRMSSGGSKYFTAEKTGNQTYIYFNVGMVKESYGPVYGGRVRIIL